MKFRANKVGLLAGGLIRHALTDNQKKELEELKLKKVSPEGLTEKQNQEYQILCEKDDLTPAQEKKLEGYKCKLTAPKGLTPSQQARLDDLIFKLNKKPELSDGAKTYVKEVWLEDKKGFREEITDKKLKKGIQGEEDAAFLLSLVDQRNYSKNDRRITKGALTGECDIKTVFQDLEIEDKVFDAVVIDDIKCSWNPRTFMSSTFTTLYEWQLRAYLYLYDAEVGRLRYCLVNCPPDVFIDEYKKYCFQHNIIDDSDPQYFKLVRQFFLNYIYDYKLFIKRAHFYPEIFLEIAKNEPERYTPEERVKTFMIARDYDLEQTMLDSIELAEEYYKTIKLNQV